MVSKILSTAVARETVHVAMATTAIKVGEDSSLANATQLMGKHQIRHLVVANWEGKPVGILSERDVYRYMAQRVAMGESILGGTSVSKLMRKDPVTVQSNHSIHDAARMMDDMKIGCVIVINSEHHVVGIITRGDVLSFYSKLRQTAVFDHSECG